MYKQLKYGFINSKIVNYLWKQNSMMKRMLLREEVYKTSLISYGNLLIIPVKKQYAFKSKIYIINKSISLQKQAADIKTLQYTLVCYLEEVYIVMLYVIELVKYWSCFYHTFVCTFIYQIPRKRLGYFIMLKRYFI